MYFDPKMCGKRIQVLRKKKGLTQLQLSFKINVSESHLRAIETGIRGASIDLLIECSEFFQVSLDYLVLGKTDPDKAEMMMQLDLLECLREWKAKSTSEYVISNSNDGPLSYTQFKRLWQFIITRSTKERFYYRYENGKRVRHTIKPVLGEKAAHNGKVVYSIDFDVTPHQLRHTYITNLIAASVDPKTVQYLAGHENSKITMDIYAKVKYNKPQELAPILDDIFSQWNEA